MSLTNLLSPEQEALLPIYREKWRQIIASRKPIDRNNAAAGIEQAYAELGFAAPEILFFDSPVAAAKMLESAQILDSLGNFLCQFHLTPTVVNICIEQLTRENIPSGVTVSEGNISEDILSSIPFFSLMQGVANSLYIPGMSQLSLQVQMPFAEALQKLADSKEKPSPFAPVTANLTSAVAKGIPRFLFWQQQQVMRNQIRQQPWGGFFLDASDSLWKNLQPFAEPIAAEVQHLGTKIWDNTWDKLWELLRLHPQIQESHNQLSQMWQSLQQFFASSSFSFYSLADVYFLPALDFSISVLGQDYGIKNWSAIQKLTQECCWVYPFEKICVVIERPNKYHFKEGDRLHGEGQPALKFRDGYTIYAYNGVILPEKYGKIHPHQWQAEWILQERNAEIRRVLIQGIGYERLCQELKAETLDSWREYSLLKIIDIPTYGEVNGQEVQEEAIHLLKMICPSTGHIHVLRVPPDIYTAREAIRWVNWDTDPEEFAIAT